MAGPNALITHTSMEKPIVLFMDIAINQIMMVAQLIVTCLALKGKSLAQVDMMKMVVIYLTNVSQNHVGDVPHSMEIQLVMNGNILHCVQAQTLKNVHIQKFVPIPQKAKPVMLMFALFIVELMKSNVMEKMNMLLHKNVQSIRIIVCLHMILMVV